MWLRGACLPRSTQAGSELTSASLLVSPCAGVSCLVGTRNTLHIGSDERGQSRIGCHRWVASTSRLCQLAKCSRFSSPRTEPPITDSVCSLGRDEVVWSSLTSAVVSLQGHRLIWLVACATVSIGLDRLVGKPNRQPLLFSCFLVEGLRLSSPLTGRVEIINHQKKLTGLSLSPDQPNQFD